MHERKAEMAREADAFIALPGNLCVWILPEENIIDVLSRIFNSITGFKKL